MNRLAILLIFAVIPATAAAQQTDTFGGQNQSATGSGSIKLNTFEVTATVQLDEIEVYLSPQAPDTEVHGVVYADDGNGDWTLIFDSGPVVLPDGEDWKALGAGATFLNVGTDYAIGVFLPDGMDVEYWYGNTGDVGVLWGINDGAQFAFNGTMQFSVPPDPLLNGDVQGSNNPYYSRLTVWFGDDNDGDGVGEFADCDDNDPTSFPGGEEVCDGADNDCDGEVDEGFDSVEYWGDSDGDGYGDPGDQTGSCDGPPAGYVDNDGDCDDNRAGVNPAATEICDGFDTDCDGTLDADELDADGDWVPACDDCDDDADDVFPGAADDCNGVDNDCDGEIPEDCDTNDGGKNAKGGDGEGCGCATPGGAPGLLWLALAVVIARRRDGYNGACRSGESTTTWKSP